MNKKRVLSVLMVVGMVIGQMSTPVFAKDTLEKETQTLLSSSIEKLNKGYLVAGDTKVLLVDVLKDELSSDEKNSLNGREIIEVNTTKKPTEKNFNLGNRIVDVVEYSGKDIEKEIGASQAIQKIIDINDAFGYVDKTSNSIMTSIDIGNKDNPVTLKDNNYKTGASYYNLMTFYGQVKQIQKMVNGMSNVNIYNPITKLQTNQEYLKDLESLLYKIVTFDQSLNIQLDDSQKSLNFIAKEGVATFKFHMQTNGYWGYALAGDSIVNQVFDKEGGYPQNIQTQTEKGQFFKVDYGNGIYVLRDTDLQNPVLIMNDKEALLIDTDNYGKDVFKDYIKEAIGTRKLSIYITHQHGDHLINLQYLDAMDVEAVYYPKNEPTTGPTAGGVKLEDCLGKYERAGKLIKVKDGDKLSIAGKEFEVIEMKGHTIGGTQLLDITDRVLFSGDTLGSQTYKGGTTVLLSQLELWKNELNQNIERLGVNTNSCKFDYIITGHTPNKLTSHYMNWMKKCLDELDTKGLKATTKAPTGHVIVVKNNKILTSQEISKLFETGVSDEDNTLYCSISVKDDVIKQEKPSENLPTDSKKDETEDMNKDIVKTSDETNIVMFSTLVGLSVIAFIIIKKRNSKKIY